jgi:hypothetical protein
MSDGGDGYVVSTAANIDGIAKRNLFGYRYTAVAYDEIHAARKEGLLFHATRSLSYLCGVRFGMTATPVFTSPNDLWTLGKLLAVEGFTTSDRGGRAAQMQRELARAQNDLREERSSPDAVGEQPSLLRELLTDDFTGDSASHFEEELCELMRQHTAELRKQMSDVNSVLRRSSQHRIPPHREVLLQAEPTEFELEVIQAVHADVDSTKKKVSSLPVMSPNIRLILLRSSTTRRVRF